MIKKCFFVALATFPLFIFSMEPASNALKDLIDAILNNNIEEVEKLLKEGIDVNSVSKDVGLPPIKWAIHRKPEIVQLLIKYGADVNKIEKPTSAPLLHMLVFNIWLQTFALTDPNLTPETRLQFQQQRANLIKIMQIILDQPNLEINIYNQDPYHRDGTALMAAAHYGLLDVVKLLLKHGANPLLFNMENQTAADIARNNGHPEVAKYIDAFIKGQEFRRLYIPVRESEQGISHLEALPPELFEELREFYQEAELKGEKHD